MTVKLTEQTMQAARQWFADNAQGCIDEVKRGDVILPKHTSQASYFEQCEKRKIQALAGEFDHTLTFLQHAHFIQTGECIALLP